MVAFLHQVILGIVQGIVEWLPFSSEGVLLLVNTYLFGSIDMELFLRQALFLHLGTFFAALIYFRKDVKELLIGLRHYKTTDVTTKRFLNFLIIATIVSGIVGMAIFNLSEVLNTKFILTSKILTIGVGLLLLVTGLLQLRSTRSGIRSIYHLNTTDSIFTGFMQGLAVLPGFSRSGFTISSLLFRNVNETTAIKISFIMSLPIVLIANIILNFRDLAFIGSMIWGLIFAFIFGLITIHLLMKFSEKVKFGWFVIFIAIMLIIAGFL